MTFPSLIVFPLFPSVVHVFLSVCFFVFLSLSLSLTHTHTHTHTQEFAKIVEPDNVKRDLIQTFQAMAEDDQVSKCFTTVSWSPIRHYACQLLVIETMDVL